MNIVDQLMKASQTVEWLTCTQDGWGQATITLVSPVWFQSEMFTLQFLIIEVKITLVQLNSNF